MLQVFFVSKNDRGKRIFINYCSLNKQTVKNDYLLLLITDLSITWEVSKYLQK